MRTGLVTCGRHLGFGIALSFVVSLSGLVAGEKGISAFTIYRHPVKSTHLASTGYDAATRVLEIEFQNGAIYRYLEVPPTVADALERSESKGRYFARNIRGCFEFQLMTNAVR